METTLVYPPSTSNDNLYYVPPSLISPSTNLSKDKRELLVSYESDHCYTFPIFPDASAAGPTLSDLEGDTKTADKPIPELAAYGGHLNRLTFLKMAKYAGPNDECKITDFIWKYLKVLDLYCSSCCHSCSSPDRYMHWLRFRSRLDIREIIWHCSELHQGRQLYL